MSRSLIFVFEKCTLMNVGAFKSAVKWVAGCFDEVVIESDCRPISFLEFFLAAGQCFLFIKCIFYAFVHRIENRAVHRLATHRKYASLSLNWCLWRIVFPLELMTGLVLFLS